MKKITPGKIVMHIFLILFSVVQLYPLYWLFTFSLKDNNLIRNNNDFFKIKIHYFDYPFFYIFFAFFLKSSPAIFSR